MAPSPADPPAQPSAQDLLAAVALHALLSAPQQTLSLEQAVSACQRDPSSASDRSDVAAALQSLLEDELAARQGELYRATRAAIRASQLSF